MWKYWLFQLIHKSFRFLPLRVVYIFALGIIFFILLWAAQTRKNVKENVRRVLGERADEREVDRVAREIMKNAFRLYVELLYVSRLSPAKLERFFKERVEVKGLENYYQVKGTRGVVLAAAHLAGSEVLTQVIGFIKEEVLVLSEPLWPKPLHDFIHRIREREGVIFLPVSRESLAAAAQRLKEKGVVGLTIDRAIQGRGVWVPFFGEETLMPVGAVRFALETNSVLVPALSRRVGFLRYEANLYPAITPTKTDDIEADLKINTLVLLGLLEDYIRQDPAQWVVLHKVWR